MTSKRGIHKPDMPKATIVKTLVEMNWDNVKAGFEKRNGKMNAEEELEAKSIFIIGTMTILNQLKHAFEFAPENVEAMVNLALEECCKVSEKNVEPNQN